MKTKGTRGLHRAAALLLAILMMVSLLPAGLAAVAQGEEIVTIGSYDELTAFAQAVNGGDSYAGRTVRLTKNLSLGGIAWTPVGTKDAPFSGTFDGDYHVVTGLIVEGGSANYQGLFGYIKAGTVQNLVVEGTVSGGSYVGGVAAYLEGASLIRCGSRAEVSGSQYVGGVAGAAKSSSVITECFSTGAVVSTMGYAGGVFGGPTANNSAVLSYCYNTGTVSGPATVGGLAGGHKRYTSTYQNGYNAGTVTASMGAASNHGAVVGGKGGTFENLYYRTGCVTNVEEGGIAGGDHDAVTAKTEEEMKTAAFAAALNGDGSAFAADENGGYPVLAWQGQIDPSKAEEPGYHFQEATGLSAQLADMIKSAIDSTKETGGLAETDSLLGSADWMSGASSTGTDWMAMTMGRFGYFDPEGAYHFLYDDGDGYALYNAAMKRYIEETYEDNGGILHSTKATEWHRATVAIAALGGDPRHFGTYEGKDIDLIADGTYDNQNGPGRQGINGWIWGLIALDSGAYQVPDGAKYTRDDFITEILKLQLADGVDGNVYGGWDLFAGSSDPDITAMAVQALAPYYFSDKSYTYVNAKTGETLIRTVRQVVEEALDRLGSLQREAGDFASWGTVNSESTAQVLVALTALGIDPAEDDRFITGTGKTLLDGLLQYRTANGGFSHTIGGGWNSMANDQAAYALVAYWRLENGMRSLYDIRDDWTAEERGAIQAAREAVSALPTPEDSGYKAALKAALAVFRQVPETERRYVYEYGDLAKAIDMVGGEEALDTDAPYVTGITVTALPSKLQYWEGETFDPAGMVVTAAYSDGSTRTVAYYTYTPADELTPEDSEVVLTYGVLKTTVSVEVKERMPWNGTGAASDPYVIDTAEGLQALAEKTNSGRDFRGEYFVLTADIDLSGIESWPGIGKDGAQFQGSFDGQGHVISELNTTGGYKGLFGVAGDYAVIRGVGVASGHINAGNSSFCGGIVGWSNGADIVDCWNAAFVTGGYSGGIVGAVRDGSSTISGCYNLGTVKGDSVGGIVGHLSSINSCTVSLTDCYNRGEIIHKDDYSNSVGGIAGRVQNGSGNPHTLARCYNTGTIGASANTPSSGALVGWIIDPDALTDCYYLADQGVTAFGSDADTEQTTALTAEEMQASGFAGRLGTAFKEDYAQPVNGGYPLLVWQYAGDEQAAEAVAAQIAELGTVTLDSTAAVQAARAAYDALTDFQKTLVDNAADLTAAEDTLVILRRQALEQAKETAKAELADYKDPADYREAQREELASAVKAGREAIDAAADETAVAEALAEAKAVLDGIKTDAQLTEEEASWPTTPSTAPSEPSTDPSEEAADPSEKPTDKPTEPSSVESSGESTVEPTAPTREEPTGGAGTASPTAAAPSSSPATGDGAPLALTAALLLAAGGLALLSGSRRK